MADSTRMIHGMISEAFGASVEECDESMFSARDICELVRYNTGEYPKEPPKAERINPSAREMIEAEIEERKQVLEECLPHNELFQKGALYGLRFALECLGKPAEPMVSVEKVREQVNRIDGDDKHRIDWWNEWLDEQEGK